MGFVDYHWTVASANVLAQCQNVQDMHKYETCAGCEMAVYCSRECQKYDWKHGIHRKFCFSNQSHRSGVWYILHLVKNQRS